MIDINETAPLQQVCDVIPLGAEARALKAMAAHTYLFMNAEGGNRLRTQLLAGVLALRNAISAKQALHLALNNAFDPRVKTAGDEVERLIEQARRAAHAAEYGEVSA
ncbi:hypothetical protein [Nonomuraea sp. NPDC049028]|uniref:hypothetical protein n=1 Tax=Nonomuraea sp. NPDC049028 TaxID=3364348 RepID=UPI003721B413